MLADNKPPHSTRSREEPCLESEGEHSHGGTHVHRHPHSVALTMTGNTSILVLSDRRAGKAPGSPVCHLSLFLRSYQQGGDVTKYLL